MFAVPHCFVKNCDGFKMLAGLYSYVIDVMALVGDIVGWVPQ